MLSGRTDRLDRATHSPYIGRLSKHGRSNATFQAHPLGGLHRSRRFDCHGGLSGHRWRRQHAGPANDDERCGRGGREVHERCAGDGGTRVLHLHLQLAEGVTRSFSGRLLPPPFRSLVADVRTNEMPCVRSKRQGVAPSDFTCLAGGGERRVAPGSRARRRWSGRGFVHAHVLQQSRAVGDDSRSDAVDRRGDPRSDLDLGRSTRRAASTQIWLRGCRRTCHPLVTTTGPDTTHRSTPYPTQRRLQTGQTRPTSPSQSMLFERERSGSQEVRGFKSLRLHRFESHEGATQLRATFGEQFDSEIAS